jgi:hypothetical protein
MPSENINVVDTPPTEPIVPTGDTLTFDGENSAAEWTVEMKKNELLGGHDTPAQIASSEAGSLASVFEQADVTLAEEKQAIIKNLEDESFSKESILGALASGGSTALSVVGESAAMINLSPSELNEVARAMVGMSGGTFQFLKILDATVETGVFDKNVAEEMINHGDGKAVERHLAQFNLDGLDPYARARIEASALGIKSPAKVSSDAYDTAFAAQLSPDVDAPEGMALLPIEKEVATLTGQELDLQEIPKELPENEISPEVAGFDPENELGKILKAPTGERADLLKSFKEKLAYQKRGLAEVQSTMVEDIRANPDMTSEEFERVFDERTEKLHITKDQRKSGIELFRKFQSKHLAVENARAEFPDDAKLFEKMFGTTPKGAIEVIKGPMTLYVRCHNKEDYALVYSGACQKTDMQVTAEDASAASATGAVAGIAVLIPELRGVVTAENAKGSPFDEKTRVLYDHEEQHAINAIAQRGVSKEIDYGANALRLLTVTDALSEVSKKLDSAVGVERMGLEKEAGLLKEEIENLNVRRLRSVRGRDADKRAQDEILAYTRDGRDLDAIFATLTKEKSDGGIYDYLSGLIASLKSPVTSGVVDLNPALASEMSADFEIQKKNVFETEYHKVIQSGLDAYKKLRDAGYKEEAIRGIFHDEPLARWEKVVDRLVEPKQEVPKDILDAYQEKFGINPEDLESIEGFETLSRGQQKQVLENLAQLTIGRIHEEAAEGHDKDIALEKASASKFGSKFLGKVWVGVKDSFTKKFDIVNREKELASEIEVGGMEKHEAVLKQMVKGMKEFGPAIKENADGGLEVQFMETDGLSPDAAKMAEAFNEQATSLSKIPYEWSLDTATKEQKKAYADEKEAYETYRGGLLNFMKESGGAKGEAMAIAAMAHTEQAIEMQRFIQTAPDSGKELTKIEDQNAWTAAMKSVGAERGYYMVGGAIARTAIGAVAGFVAAPIVAAGAAGIRGWRRTGDELLKQDVAQRKGEVVSGNATAKNMIESFRADDIAGDKEAQSGDRRRGATAKIEYLKAQIASVEDMLMTGLATDEAKNMEEKKAKLTAQLDRRMNYTKMKISDGKMVFGKDDERLGNQYALMRSMAEAEGMLVGKDAVDENGEKAERRLAKLLNATDADIKDARFNKKLTSAVKAGAIGGMLAGLGASAADLMKWYNGGNSVIKGVVFGQGENPTVLSGGMPMEITPGRPSLGSVPEGEVYTHPGLDAEGTLMAHPGLSDEGMLAARVNGLDLPPDYRFPSVEAGATNTSEALGAYAVKSGDTMTSILRGKFPGITDTQIENLRTQDLTKFGIKSGNLDKIGLTDKLDMGKIEEAIKAGKGSGVALHTPPAGGVVGKMFADEQSDYAGPAGEKEVYKNFFPETDTPRIVNQEDIPVTAEEQIIKAFRDEQESRVVPAEIAAPQAAAEKLAYEQYARFPDRRTEIAKILGVSEAELNKKLGVSSPYNIPTASESEARGGVGGGARMASPDYLERGVEMQNKVVNIDTLTPGQQKSYFDAINSIKNENGGVFPKNITQGELLRRQLAIEDGSSLRAKGNLGVEAEETRVSQLQKVQEMGRPSMREAGMAKIDMAEENAIRKAKIAYEAKLASLESRQDYALEKANTKSINRGIGEIKNIISGDTDKVIRNVTREATSRMQGAMTGEIKHSQAIDAARLKYENSIIRAHESAERARAALDVKEMSAAAKAAAKAPKN